MASIISAGTTSGTALNMAGDTSGVLQLATNGSTTAVTVDASQNVGIGTASPSAILQVNSAAATVRPIVTATTGYTDWVVANTGGNIYFGIDNSTGGVSGTAYGRHIYSDGAYPLDFFTNSTQRMRIDSSGNVLVGTTSGVAGGGKIQIANGTGRAINTIGSSGDLSIEPLRIGKFDNNSTTSQLFIRFTINNDNAGSGQINANGASSAAFGSYSDISLKENIKLLPSQINNIMALKPSEFDYKDGSGHQIGFIAQEIQEVYPDVVSPDENGLLMVTGWSKTEARLTKAIQEQQTIINDLKARITALEGAA